MFLILIILSAGILACLVTSQESMADTWQFGQLRHGETFEYYICDNVTLDRRTGLSSKCYEMEMWVVDRVPTDTGPVWILHVTILGGEEKHDLILLNERFQPQSIYHQYVEDSLASTIFWGPKYFTEFETVIGNSIATVPSKYNDVDIIVSDFVDFQGDREYLLQWSNDYENQMWIRNTSPLPSKATVYSEIHSGFKSHIAYEYELKSHSSNFDTTLGADEGFPDGFFPGNVGGDISILDDPFDEMSENDITNDIDVFIPEEITPSDIQENGTGASIPDFVPEEITPSDQANDTDITIPDFVPEEITPSDIQENGTGASIPDFVPEEITPSDQANDTDITIPDFVPEEITPSDQANDTDITIPDFVPEEITPSDQANDTDITIPDFVPEEITPSDIQENGTGNDITNDTSNDLLIVNDDVPGDIVTADNATIGISQDEIDEIITNLIDGISEDQDEIPADIPADTPDEIPEPQATTEDVQSDNSDMQQDDFLAGIVSFFKSLFGL